MTAKAKLFLSHAGQLPDWLAPLLPRFAAMNIELVHSPPHPSHPPTPFKRSIAPVHWSHWNEETIAETLTQCGYAMLLNEVQGTPSPHFAPEVRTARALFKQGTLAGIAYIQTIKPSHISHDAAPMIAQRKTLAVQIVPGATRSMLDPIALPAFLAKQWPHLHTPPKEDEEEAPSQEEASQEQPPQDDLSEIVNLPSD